MSLTRDNQRTASYLLPAPGGEVVRQLLDEVEAVEARCAKLEAEGREREMRLLDFLKDNIANILYCMGSLCFLIGTQINMFKN